MKPSVLFAVVLLVGALGIASSQERPGMSYESGSLAFPVGDPTAGRVVYVLYRCTACHRVTGDRELPAPVARELAPELGVRQAAQTACELVESVISPSHRVDPEVKAHTEGALSPMGDFTDSMTVRQLTDLVAYLKSLGAGAVDSRSGS